MVVRSCVLIPALDHFHIHRFKITLLFKKTEKREKEAGNGPIKKVLFVRPNI